MDPAIQQAIALGIVVLVVALVAYRRWKQHRDGREGCDGCSEKSGQIETNQTSGQNSEHTIRFFRKRH